MPGEPPRKQLPGAPQPSKKIFERTRDAIEEAAAAGFFSNLPGSGRPLDFSFEENPYIPEDMRTAWRMLHSSGYALPWMEDRKDIDKKRTELTRRLEAHLARVRSSVDRIPRIPDYLQPSRWTRLNEEHADFVTSFCRSADQLNVRIDIYNLSVPSLALQTNRFDVREAMKRLDEAIGEAGKGT